MGLPIEEFRILGERRSRDAIEYYSIYGIIFDCMESSRANELSNEQPIRERHLDEKLIAYDMCIVTALH